MEASVFFSDEFSSNCVSGCGSFSWVSSSGVSSNVGWGSSLVSAVTTGLTFWLFSGVLCSLAFASAKAASMRALYSSSVTVSSAGSFSSLSSEGSLSGGVISFCRTISWGSSFSTGFSSSSSPVPFSISPERTSCCCMLESFSSVSGFSFSKVRL